MSSPAAALESLLQAGRLEDAEAHARDALDRAPADPTLHTLLVHTLLARGRRAEAAVHAAAALRHGPPPAEHLHALVATLSMVTLPTDDPHLRAALVALLQRTDVDAAAVGAAVTRLLLGTPAFHAAIRGGQLGALVSDPLVLAWLGGTLCADVTVETWLYAVRAALGRAYLASGHLSAAEFELACAVGRQAFLAGHAWAPSVEDETHQVALLRAVHQTPWDESAWALLAAHVPLHTVPGADLLLSLHVSTPLQHLVDLHVRTVREEQALLPRAPRRAPRDDVGFAVATQYEDHPHPRWSACAVPSPTSPAEWLAGLFPHFEPPPFLRGSTAMLVAGAGTGQRAVVWGRRFPSARILGLDLAHQAVARARRMAERFGVSQVDFQVGDLRALRGLRPSFHLVEAVGVLHQTAQPVEALRALTDVLVRGGLLCLGVDTRMRPAVHAARRAVAQWGLSLPRLENIRAARARLMVLPKEHPARGVLALPEFHSMDGCRALLFPAHEIPLGLADLPVLLAGAPLRWLGLEAPTPAAQAAFSARGSPTHTLADLSTWLRLDEEDPAWLGGQAVVWLQKV